jgi:MFS superfamily sulfate permease-like transporter
MNFKSDLSASIIVFFVALPLCLGIALASNAPIMAGLLAGIVGGVVVGFLSGSQLGVSGPAAGLTVIVSAAIATLGSWEAFLAAVIVAGMIQFIFGYFKLGFLAYFFPVSVIYGMLAGIGLLIILKQLPHAVGYNKSFFGEEEFMQLNHENTFSAILHSLTNFELFSLIIFILSLAILILWEVKFNKINNFFKIIQGPIAVVFIGTFIVVLNQLGIFQFLISPKSLIEIENVDAIFNFSFISIPDLDYFFNLETYKTALLIAIVASLETLLCLEATDKLDPEKRISPPNQELKAQGIGNFICGFAGALPITQVIVRSSANINFGAKTKASAILHGLWLILAVLILLPVLTLIPLASLSAILMIVGYKLAKPSLFRQMFNVGYEQFIPFVVTIIGIISTNLLNGIVIGLVVGLFFSLYTSYKNSFELQDKMLNAKGHEKHHIVLAEEVSFFNKANLIEKLNSIPGGSEVIVDFKKNKYISYDIELALEDFKVNAQSKQINLKFINKP